MPTLKELGITLALIGAVVFYSLIVYQGCKRPTINPDATKLEPSDVAKVTTTPSHIVITKRKPDGKVEVKVRRNSKHGTVTVVKKDGTIDVRSKDLGSSNDFGLSTDFRGLGVGTEFLYYKSLSLLGGSHFIDLKRGELQLHLYVGVGYRLPYQKLSNVSVFAGFDTDRKVIGGLFLRFGDSE